MTDLSPVEAIRDIARALVHEAAIADRPGQMERLEEMSADLHRAADKLGRQDVDGICGHEVPRISDSVAPPVYCELRHGHQGWHSSEGCHWNRGIAP